LSLLIRSYAEIELRPEFSIDCMVTKENLQSLIAKYELPDDVVCHVIRDLGRCGRKHKDGWLGKTKDGPEGLIGGHCAKKYFKGHQGFQSDRARIDRQIEIDGLTLRYTAFHDDPQYAERVEALLNRSARVQKALVNALSKLPLQLQRRLEAMSKTSNTDVVVQSRRIEMVEGENGKPKPKERWDNLVIGKVEAVAIFDYARSAQIRRDVNAVAAAYREVQEHAAPRTIRLKATVRTLETLPACERELANLDETTQRFLTPSNLQLLCFMSTRDSHRALTAALVLQRSRRVNTEEESRRFVAQLDAAMRDRAPMGFRIL
jgi:hypothetical protein